MTDAASGSRLRSWAYALRTTNPPPGGPVDAVTRWIVVSRAAVLPMTLVSGLVAALLAVGHPDLDVRWLVLAIVGITLAHVTLGLMVAFYVLVAVAVLLGAMPWPALLVLAALPRLMKVRPYIRRPPPAEPPPGFPVWPLWYAALAWVHVRRAGALLVLGLAIGAAGAL